MSLRGLDIADERAADQHARASVRRCHDGMCGADDCPTCHPGNLIAGRHCPPVVCQRSGFAFRWWNGYRWAQGDELPAEIMDALPPNEQDRCEAHRFRRMGERA